MLEISVRVTLGDSRASPRATTRMALMRCPGADRLEDVLVRLEGGVDDDAHAAQLGVGGDLPVGAVVIPALAHKARTR
jgi:hypothetical protein